METIKTTFAKSDTDNRLKMELKVWVEGIQRIVCGVTDKTTCQVGQQHTLNSFS